MSYTALYRKYRPRRFEDVRGQDATVTTLKNQITSGRIGHAYLFCGTRGTGKTTIAKIFAQAVNCENPAEGSPCGECASCRSIAAGASMDVAEIDAASNNGVENIRKIRGEVSYRPTEGKYRVYIIDEAHMLSPGAFNALLKTLEEPPSYVIFILATTEAHKIPVTILSRCQRYDFRRISAAVIYRRLEEILETEQAQAQEKALRYLAKAADGAMRDAVSLLDQCLAFYMGQTLTYEKVLKLLGAVDTEVFGRLFARVLAQDVQGVMEAVEALSADGRDLAQFAGDFTWYLRNVLLLKSAPDLSDALDLSDESRANLMEEAANATEDALIRYIRIFSELSGQMKYSSQKRILLEVALIKLCRPQMEQDLTSLIGRIEQLEKKLAHGILPAAPQPAGTGSKEPEKKKPQLKEALPDDIKQAVREWRSIVAAMPNPAREWLGKARLAPGHGNELMLVFEDALAAGFFQREGNRAQLEDAIAEKIGSRAAVAIQEKEGEGPFEESYVDLEQMIHMEITYEG